MKGVSDSLNVSEEDIGWYSMEHTVTDQLDSQVFRQFTQIDSFFFK